MTRSGLRWGLIALLPLGALLFWLLGTAAPFWEQQSAWFIAGMVILAVPWSGRAVSRWLERIRRPTPAHAARAAIFIAIAAAAYLLLTGWIHGRAFIPKFHDEQMHLLQMRMLAHGRLWMPAHQLADFFETFFVITRPVYAAVYFPGTSLLYVPGVWLHLPFWLLPALLAGATTGLLYLVMTELIDGLAGALSVALLLALPWFRYFSLVVMSHPVELFFGILLIWLYLRWRTNRQWGWLAAMGAAAGWAAITRPLDTLAYAIPVALAVAWELRRASWGRRLQALAIPCLFILPFLALQGVFDVGVTGKVFSTPYQLYLNRDQPLSGYGFHTFDPGLRPESALPQKRDYYVQFLLPDIKRHRLGELGGTWWDLRLPQLFWTTLASTLLLVLLPLAALELGSAPRRVVALTLALYVVLYVPFPFFLPHYPIVIAPAMIMLVLLGRHAIERAWGPAVRRRWITPATALLVLSAALPSFADLNPRVRDDLSVLPVMTFNYTKLPKLVEKPAIVLYRYARGSNPREEPVYNIATLKPDDAPVIRAHDLGAVKDMELVRYYASRQPKRHIYWVDRGSGEVKYLGTAAVLAHRSALPIPLKAGTRR